MAKSKGIVDNLVKSGVINDAYLSAEGRAYLEGLDLSDEEIAQLAALQKKLGLSPLPLTGPVPSPGFQVWML
jgi:hypothetical protein